MKLFVVVSVLAGAVTSVFGLRPELGAPTDGTVLSPGQNFTAQVVDSGSILPCIPAGIALSIASCNEGVCPKPSDRLGSVLYAGPWIPTTYNDVGRVYQNFTLQVPTSMSTGPAVFALTSLCLLGVDPRPHLEFDVASLTID